MNQDPTDPAPAAAHEPVAEPEPAAAPEPAGAQEEALPADAPLEEGDREFVEQVVVARPRRELYEFWRDFTNLPRFMRNVRSVTAVDSLSSVWSITDADGRSAEWEFLITDDEQDRLIAWSASGKTPIRYSGRVEFHDAAADEAPGTRVTATVRYQAPDGLVDTLIAKVAGGHSTADDPAVQTRGDLARFKQCMEDGLDGGGLSP
jgi:uncharacterized membrane protein